MGQVQWGAPLEEGGPLEDGGPLSEGSVMRRLAEETPVSPEGDSSLEGASASASGAAAAAAAAARLLEVIAATPQTGDGEASSSIPTTAAPTAAATAAGGPEGGEPITAAEGETAAGAAAGGGETDEAEGQGVEIHRELICCVCFDLLQKPVLLQCGHVFCFWCAYRSMNAYEISVCPLCRCPFDCLPPICRPLYLFIMSKYPAAAARRDRELEALERQRTLKSPPHHLIAKGPPGPALDLLPLTSTSLLLLLREEAPELLPLHLVVDLRVAAAACKAEELWALSRTRRSPATTTTATAAAAAGAAAGRGRGGGGGMADEVTSDTDEGPLRVGPVWRQGPPQPGMRRHAGDTPAADISFEDSSEDIAFPAGVSASLGVFGDTSVGRHHHQQQQLLLLQHGNAAAARGTGGMRPPTDTLQPAPAGAAPAAAVSESSTDQQQQEQQQQQQLEETVDGGEAFVHYGVICYMCGRLPIVGPRFKCIDCLSLASTYDVCGACKEDAAVKAPRFASQHKPHHRLLLVEPTRADWWMQSLNRLKQLHPELSVNQILQWILMHYQEAAQQEGRSLSTFDS
ncbi:hypothetical protein ACSSS7_007579 [Eimeria intestinalis]